MSSTLFNILIASIIPLPILFVFLLMKSRVPKDNGFLIYGLILIIYSAVVFSELSVMSLKLAELFQLAKQNDLPNLSEYEQVKSYVETWVYIAPAVIAAIGANLITEYIKVPLNK